MKELAAFLLVFTALALVHGAHDGVRRWAWLRVPGRALATRAAALVLLALAFLVWRQAEPGPAAFFAVPVAAMASGTALPLLAPFRMRWVAWLTAAALPVAVALLTWSATRG